MNKIMFKSKSKVKAFEKIAAFFYKTRCLIKAHIRKLIKQIK